jgi:heme/copper-type cytochrome/quinol oxidase subunit 2
MQFLKRALKVLVLSALLTGCAGSPTFLSPASPVAGDEAGLYRVIVYMAAGVFVLVEGILVYSILRFRRRPDDAQAPRQIYGNTRLEVIWTGTPILLVATLFALTIHTMGPPTSNSRSSATSGGGSSTTRIWAWSPPMNSTSRSGRTCTPRWSRPT